MQRERLVEDDADGTYKGRSSAAITRHILLFDHHVLFMISLRSCIKSTMVFRIFLHLLVAVNMYGPRVRNDL